MPFVRKNIDEPVDVTMDIADFHKKFGLDYTGDPHELDPLLQRFRMRFIREEYLELRRAMTEEFESDNEHTAKIARENQLDAIIDLMYVLLGYAYLRGWDFEEAWRRVHAANMKKRRANPGEGRSFWDVVKPEGWMRPNLLDLV